MNSAARAQQPEECADSRPQPEMAQVVEQGVRHRRHQQRQQQAQRLPADHDDGHRPPRDGSRPAAHRHRRHARDQRRGSHQNGTQPVLASLVDRLHSRHAVLEAQRLDVVDLQNRVLLHDAEQHQNAQRGVDDREVLPGEDQRQQRERHRQREADQDGDGVDEALELRGQHHVHEHDRQQQRDDVAQRGASELAGAAEQARAVLRRHIEARHRLIRPARGPC